MNNVMRVTRRTITLYKVGWADAKKIANLCATDDELAMVERLKNFTATEGDLRRAAELLEFKGGATPLAEDLRRALPTEPTSKKAARKEERTEKAVAKALRRP